MVTPGLSSISMVSPSPGMKLLVMLEALIRMARPLVGVCVAVGRISGRLISVGFPHVATPGRVTRISQTVCCARRGGPAWSVERRVDVDVERRRNFHYRQLKAS